MLWLTYQHFAMNDQDKNKTDMARHHKVILLNGDLQQFVYRLDEMLSIMEERLPDEDLMNLFVLQPDVSCSKNHGSTDRRHQSRSPHSLSLPAAANGPSVNVPATSIWHLIAFPFLAALTVFAILRSLRD